MKKCRICKTGFTQFNSMQSVCSPMCAHKHAQNQTENKIQKQQREDSKSMRARRKAIKSIAAVKGDVQPIFNKFIRLRDFHLGCSSCDRTKQEVESQDTGLTGGVWDAGHYLGRGARPDLAFNEDNCHKQCKKCNGGSGKYARKNHTVQQSYRIKLIQKIGVERVEALEVDKNYKFTREELYDIKQTYKAKVKQLESELN